MFGILDHMKTRKESRFLINAKVPVLYVPMVNAQEF